MFRTVLLFLLIISCSVPAFAANRDFATVPGYRAKAVYTGIYKTERLYQFNPYAQTWYASNDLKFWDRLRCQDARQALAETGEWIGVLAEGGVCAGAVEGQRWGTGNYLNFLAGGNPIEISR